MTHYWLFKTEPDEFSIHDLAAKQSQSELWTGVRNYQARNYLRDAVEVGDQVLIYHSSCKVIGIAGIAQVTATHLPDPSQFDPELPYYDPKATHDKPRWWTVGVIHKETFAEVFPLTQIKKMSQIRQLGLVKKGHRLSVMPVAAEEFELLVTSARCTSSK